MNTNTKKMQSLISPRFYLFFFIFVALAIFCLVIYVMNYYSFKKRSRHEQTANQYVTQTSPTTRLSVAPTSISNTTSDLIANWQEYINSKYGFSIKVNPDFKHSFTLNVNANTKTGITSLDQDTFLHGSTTEAGFSGEALQILIYPKKGNESWVDYGATQVGPNNVKGTFALNGIIVRKILDVPFGTVFIGPMIHNGYVYNFEIYGSSEESAYKNAYTMLDTFKFIN